MDKFLRKGSRVTGTDRARLAADLRRRYDAGESIRSLAASTGRSYGFVHRILAEAGVPLRGRTGSTASLSARARNLASKADRDSIYVYVYLDTEDADLIQRAIDGIDNLIEYLGYQDLVDLAVEHGSFIRRSRAQARVLLSSPELTDRVIKLERALELAALDIRQAEVDARAAQVVASLMDALKEIPNACIRAGSTVMIKYSVNGTPVVRSRQLSQLEVRAWEKYPEIQSNPAKFLEALAFAVEGMQKVELE